MIIDAEVHLDIVRILTESQKVDVSDVSDIGLWQILYLDIYIYKLVIWTVS